MSSPVPLIVLSAREDDVELVNRSLRDAGHAVRCHWVMKVDALAAAIEEHAPQLLFLFAETLSAPVREIARIRQQASLNVPLVVVRSTADEAEIAEALLSGAQDLVSAGQIDRLRSIAERELRAYRLERALNETLVSANQYKQQLKAFLAGSIDAIAHVQEGILVDANQAWAELLGFPEADALLGGPLMDFFEPASHAALKGALVACAKGQWSSETLNVVARTASGAALPLRLKLAATTVDGEPGVKLAVPREPAPVRTEPERLVEQTVHQDPATGLYHRRRFLELLTDRLEAAPRGGVRALAYVRPDKFREIEEQIGPIASEDVIAQIAAELRSLAHPGDLCGRFGGQVLSVFLERGTLRDVEAWAQSVVARLADRIFESAHNTLSLTCTIGLAEVGPDTNRLDALVASARRGAHAGRGRGGNCVVIEQTSDESTRVQRFDEIWVREIKSALMENRFKLAHLPIANLGGEPKVMYDTLLRLIDAQGDELPASEFMPAAARNNLLRAIDRWVIGATVAFCAHTQADRVFVKISGESIIDKTLVEWLAKAVESSGVPPAKLCFEVSEENAARYLAQTRGLAEELRRRGHAFAIEHFGVGRDPARVLAQTPMDYLKIDGALMQNVATDGGLQEKVRAYVSAASKRNIPTIAERVENANTMAVLFQLGVAYMQGHYVHEPEVVLAEPQSASG